jgi:uncharacterized protein (UPF0261 family)
VIVMIGTFDTKEVEFAYLRERILERGHDVFTVNVGIMSTPQQFPVDVAADAVALAGGGNLSLLRQSKNRDLAMEVMCRGAASLIPRLFEERRLQGIIGMGGGCGTSIVTSAMRALPLGVPKLCVSTLAGGDVSAYVGTKDIVMFPSLVDIAGINRLSRVVIANAAGALCGMAETQVPSSDQDDAPVIAATMFGNTTECVQSCVKLLNEQGFEVIVFHATGKGGQIMETFIEQGYINAVLDLTTTEIADEVCGGIMSAGDSRLTAAGRMGLPQVVSVGCVDMVNFGPRPSIPSRYEQAGRRFYAWNPFNTLMRTNAAENRAIGEVIGSRLNQAKGPVTVLLPLRGLSVLDEEGEPFCDRKSDNILFETLRSTLRPDIEIVEIDAPINNPMFSEKAVKAMNEMIKQQ